MSGKASEILGVSAKRPHTGYRRAYTPGGEDTIPSRAPSRLQFDTYGRPSTTRSGTPQFDRERTSYSIDLAAHSVRFANAPLSTNDNPLALRPLNDPEPPSPSVTSSRRGPPSSWRGLVSRAGGSTTSMSSRASQDSESTLRSQTVGDVPSRSKSILKSALSRLTLRSSKSKSSLRPGRSGFSTAATTAASTAASTAVTTAAPSAIPTAATTRHATPRARSPSDRRIPLPAGQIREETRGTESTQQAPIRRKNSRMPLEVDRPPTRNWFDGLDEADFDDAKQTSTNVSHQAKPSVVSTNEMTSPASKIVRHFSRPLVLPPPAPSDLEVHPQNDGLINSNRLTKPSDATSLKRKKRRSKGSEIEPQQYSILNLSDSDEGKDVAAAQPQRVVRPFGHSTRGSNESNSSMKKPVVASRQSIGRTNRSAHPPSKTASALKVDEELAELSPSLPSLVESGSSRQASVISSTSYGRQAMINSTTGNSINSSKQRTLEDRYEELYRDSDNPSDQSKLGGLEIEEQDFMQAQENQQNNAAFGQTDRVMTSLSREELAWLAHMRNNRSMTLQALTPSRNVAEKPNPLQDQFEEDIAVEEYGYVQPTVINQPSKSSEANLTQVGAGQRDNHEVSSDDELLINEARDSVLYAPLTSREERPGVSPADSGLRIAVTDGVQETPTPDEATENGVAWSNVEPKARAEAESEAVENGVTLARYDEPPSSDDQQEPETPGASEDAADLTAESPVAADKLDGADTDAPDLDTSEVSASGSVDTTGTADSGLEIRVLRRMAHARQESISYAEARSRFERPVSLTKSSLPVPVPKRASHGAARAPSYAAVGQSPRLPVPAAAARTGGGALHPSGASRGSSGDAASVRSTGTDYGPPTPNLASFPQPPGGAGGNAPPEALGEDVEPVSESRRSSAGSLDVLAAWQSLGGG